MYAPRRMHPDTRGMAFLMSLGALPIACTSGGGEDSSGGASTSTTGTTTTGTGTATVATDTPTTDPTPNPATSTSTGTTSTGTTGTGTDTGEPTTYITSDPGGVDMGPPPTDDQGCIVYAAKVIECLPRYADYRQQVATQCAEYKMNGLMLDGQPCADAIEAQNVCFSQASCADLESEAGCQPEQMAVEAACPNLLASETDTGGFADTGG